MAAGLLLVIVWRGDGGGNKGSGDTETLNIEMSDASHLISGLQVESEARCFLFFPRAPSLTSFSHRYLCSNGVGRWQACWVWDSHPTWTAAWHSAVSGIVLTLTDE